MFGAGAWLELALVHKTLLTAPRTAVFPNVSLFHVSPSCLLAGQMPGPGSMMPGQPMPGRMMPNVPTNIHPAGAPPPGMSPMAGNLIGPRVPLAAPNGMCKWICGSKPVKYTWGGFSGAHRVAGKAVVVETSRCAAGTMGCAHTGSWRCA